MRAMFAVKVGRGKGRTAAIGRKTRPLAASRCRRQVSVRPVSAARRRGISPRIVNRQMHRCAPLARHPKRPALLIEGLAIKIAHREVI